LFEPDPGKLNEDILRAEFHLDFKLPPHHLVADGPVIQHRRTRAGDNWADGVRPKTAGVSLGLPSFGAPAPVTSVSEGCAVS